jgi:hypothetical protein
VPALCGSFCGSARSCALRSEEMILVTRRKRRSSSQEKSEDGLSALAKSRESLPPMRSREAEECGKGLASVNRLRTHFTRQRAITG